MRLIRPSLFATSLALISALSASCTTQDPAVLDPLDPPEPGVDSLVLVPQEIATTVGVAVTFAVPDTTVLGTPVSGPISWSATGGTIDSSGVFVAADAGTFTVNAVRDGREGRARVIVSVAPEPPGTPVTLRGIEVTPSVLRVAPAAKQQFAAIGRLSNGNPVTVRVIWTATGGTITSGGLFTAGTTAGNYRVIATREGDTPADTSSVTVTSTSATLIGIQASPAVISIAPADVQQFSAVGKNSDGSNSAVLVNWSATGGTITPAGVYTAGSTPGTFRVIAVRQGDTKADTSAVTITAPAPTLTALEVTPLLLRVAPAAKQQFAAIGRLSNGNPVTVRVIWTATGGTITSSGLFTAGTTAGNYRVIATREGDTPADTSSVTVTSTSATLIGIQASPAVISIAPADVQQFSAVGKNSDGSNSAVLVNWSATGGTITPAGVYTAGSTPGTFRVIAVRQGDTKADTSAVTITAPAPTLTALEVTPANASVAAGATQQFTALGRMSDGSATSVSVTWSATGGTITTAGRYSAGATTGTYRVIAMRQGDTESDTSRVTITTASSSPTAPTLSAVVVTPGTASLAAGATQQFTAAGRMSDGSTGSVSVTWSATGGTVSTSGLYKAGTTAGSYRVIAVQQGGTRADTSAITVTTTATAPAPAPSNGTADPTLLPSANGQGKNVTAYAALNVRAMASGGSYTDPVTGVRVWKVTSATMPMSNPGAGHDYSEGPVQVSREWGGNKHTLLLRVDYGGYWLVDLTRGSGLSNWRQLPVAPRGTSAASFSQNPATPQILYVASGSGLVRVNTATNQVANTGNFPASVPLLGWLTQDKQDGWFVGLGTTSGTVVAWNSQTNETRTRSFSGLDEPYFDRDGRYVFANTGSTSSIIWDLQTNTTRTITAPGNSGFFHLPALRGFFMATDVNTGAGQTPLWRVDPSTAAQNAQVSTLGGYAPDNHAAGQWVQEDATLPGGDRTKQWFLRSAYDWSYAATGGGAKEALAFIRADGSDFRLLAHHYSTFSGSLPADPFKYWSTPRGTPSPDGKVVLFDSNMLAAGSPARYDAFVAEVPVR